MSCGLGLTPTICSGENFNHLGIRQSNFGSGGIEAGNSLYHALEYANSVVQDFKQNKLKAVPMSSTEGTFMIFNSSSLDINKIHHIINGTFPGSTYRASYEAYGFAPTTQSPTQRNWQIKLVADPEDVDGKVVKFAEANGTLGEYYKCKLLLEDVKQKEAKYKLCLIQQESQEIQKRILSLQQQQEDFRRFLFEEAPPHLFKPM